MIDHLERRFLSFFLAVLMIISVVPVNALAAGSRTETGSIGEIGWNASIPTENDGTADLGSVAVDGTTMTITAVAEPVYTPGSGGTCPSDPEWNFNTTSTTVTLTNNMSAKALISFDYTAPASGKLLINNTEKATSGTFESGSIEAGATVTIKLESPEDGTGDINDPYSGVGNSATVNLTQITIVADESRTMTVKPGTNGTVSVAGTDISANWSESVQYAAGVDVSAAAASGYKFLAWVDENGTVLATTASANIKPEHKGVTVSALFVSTSENGHWIGNKKIFTDFQQALDAAEAGDKMVKLMDKATLSKSYTIPAGVTVLVPHNQELTVYGANPVAIARPEGTLAAPKAYSTLTLGSGVVLTVRGSLEAAAQHYVAHGGKYDGGRVIDYYGHIVTGSGSRIDLESGGKLYAWGYVTGSGSVNAKSGATVYEKFQIADYRGGGITSIIVPLGVFPFNQYYVQNVEVPETIHAGASLICHAGIYGSEVVTSSIEFIGSNGMFKLGAGGKATKRYDAASDRLIIDVEGQVGLNGISLMGYDTANFILPINNNITVNVNSGVTTINQDVMLQPGTEVNVDRDAYLMLASGKKVYLMDSSDWGNYCFGAKMRPIYWTVANGATVKRSTLTDARINLDGTAVIQGQAYASTAGALIESTGKTGVMVLMNSAPSSTTDVKQSTITASSQVLNATTKISVGAALLTNADNTTVNTKGAAQYTTYVYDTLLDKWVTTAISIAPTLTYHANDGSETPATVTNTVNFQNTALSTKPLSFALAQNTFTREGYTFGGWGYVTPAATAAADESTEAAAVEAASVEAAASVNEFEKTFNPGDFVTISADTILYAKWNAESFGLKIVLDENASGTEQPVACGTDLSTILPQNPEKAGFKFNGWTITDTTTGAVIEDEITTMPAYSVTFTANWVKAYTLKFLDETGNVLKDAEGKELVYLYTADETVTATYPEYTKDGYTITWNKEIPKKLTENLEITAEATEASYTVSFYDGDQEAGEATTDENGNVTIISLQGDGKHKLFKGWATTQNAAAADDNYKPETQVKLTSNLDLYAVWETTTCKDNLTAHEEVPATCLEAGNIAYWSCDVCGNFYKDAEAKTGIDPEGVVTEAKGHTFKDIAANAATCEAAGNEAHKQCTACNLYFAENAAKDATDGKATNADFVKAQLQHSYTGAIKKMSDGKDGKHAFLCVNGCNQYGGAVAHTWDDGVETTASTCLGTGVKTYTCDEENCGATYTETLSAKGHSFGAVTDKVDATCQAGGNEAYKQCTVCQLYFAADAVSTSTDGKNEASAFNTAMDSNNHAGELKYTNNLDGTHSAAYECCNTPGVQNEAHDYSGGRRVCWDCGQEQIRISAYAPGWDKNWYGNGLEIYKNGQLVDILTLTGRDTDDEYMADYYEADTYEIRWRKGNDHEFHEGSYVIATVGDSETNSTITLFRYGGDNEMGALADGQRLYPECSGHDFSKYVDNGDGTHTVKCVECNANRTTENHTYDETAHKCECGAVETFPMHFYLNQGDETPVVTLQVPFGTALQTESHKATDELKALAAEASESLTQEPTKDHNTYDGWEIDQIATKTMPAEAVVIYARWIPVEYTITYDLNGGQFKDSVRSRDQSATYGNYFYVNAVNEPDVFPVEREGYTFVHFLDQQGIKYEPEVYGFTEDIRNWCVGAMPGYDLTLTAQWQINQYTITFANTGDTSMNPITMNYGERISHVSNPEKDGYKFVGWTDENGGTVTIPATMPGKNMTLTAQWECLHADTKAEYETSSQHAIVCSCGAKIDTEAHSANENGYCVCGACAYVEHFNGGKNITHASADHLQHFFNDEFEMRWDQDIMKTIIVREGYTFAGYAYDAEGTKPVENGAVFNKPTTVYVMWEPVPYTLTIKTNNDEIVGDSISMSVEKCYESADEMFEALNRKTVTGYHFAGYTYEDGSEVKFPFRYPATDLTLIEQYVANEYTLTIELGEHGTMGGKTTYIHTAEFDSAVELPEIVVADGYKLTGWTANFGGEDQEATALPTEMPAANGTYTAQWELVDVSVTFKDGDTIETVNGKYFDEKTAPGALTEKEGHTFLGWAETAAEDAEIVYAPGAEITLNKDVDGKTLYAKWKINTFNVTYVNGESSDDETVNWNTEITVKGLDDTASHTFNGWLGSDGKTYAAGDKITIKADLTLTAQWKINEYTITWIVEGDVTTTTVEHGKTPVFGRTPTKADDAQYTYTFAGWTPAVAEATGPATYTADFTPNLRSYDITFVVDGVETKVSTKYGEMPVFNAEAKDPAKESDEEYEYTFAGWNADLAPVTGEATYTAKWTKTPVEYTVTVKIDGEVVFSVTAGYGAEISYNEAVKNPVKTGHTFGGWDQELPATIPVKGAEINGSFEIEQYTITFMNGDTMVDKITADYGASITAPAPTKEGHKLTGWKDADGNAFTATTMPAGNKTVYAQWQVESYDVTWKINGEPYTTTSVAFGAAITAPVPTKDGYTFSGWSAFPEKMPAEPLTISGSWTPINYTITFMNGDVEYAEITAAYESEITMPEEPTKEGCTFAGWVDVSGSPVNLTTMPLDGMTVYASFTIDTFKVNFYASQDDTQVFESFDVLYGTKLLEITEDDPETPEDESKPSLLVQLLNKIAAEPEKKGHTWKEWDTSKVPETMPAGNLDIYGTWDVNSYTVTAEGQTYTFQYGKAVTIPKPTKAGYTFIEWNETVPTTMPAYNVVLTAKWNPNTYTITFVGADVENITATYGTAITKPADPTMVGYTFQGWSVDGKTVIEFPATMPVDGLNLKAVWAPDTIYITWIIEGVETVVPYEFGAAITEPEATKATDAKWSYKHIGWDKDVPATALVNDTFTALFEEDEAVKYTVKFLDGETVVYETKIAWDGEVSLDGFTAPVKEHYTLSWTLDGEAVEFPYEMTTKQVTFLAQWTPVMYTVTIDGGKPVSYPYGAELHIDDPAPKEGHTFAGWLKNGTAYQIPDTMPGENLKLTSSWTVNTYTLTVSSNDAEGNYVEKILTVPYGAKLSQYYLETPSYIYEGKLYEFDRWAVWTWETGKDETMVPYEGSTMPASDVTMYTTSTVTGWETDEDGNTTYYVKSEMVYFADMVTIDGAEYWFNADGYIVKDITLTDDGYCAFDHESGKFLSDYTGIYEALNGDLYYVVDGMAVQNKGLVKDQFVNEQGKIHTHYYYFGCDAVGCTAEACMGAGQFKAQRNVYHWVENDNGMLMKGGYTFGDDGIIEHTEDTNRHGIQVVDGVKYYLMDGVKVHKGLFIDHGYYYYARTSGALVVNENYWVGSSKLNNLDLKAGTYTFDEEGRIVFGGGKTGIYAENNTLYYYVDGVKTYAGLIQYTGDLNNADGSVTNDVYNNSWIYVNTQGEVKNGCDYWISKTNDHMIAKSYTFDVNGIMQNPQVSDSAEIKNGVYAEDGSLYFYVNNKRSYEGLIIYSGDLHKADGTVVEGVYDNDFIYVNTQGEVKNGCNYWISKNNGYMKNKSYNFDENGIMTNPQPIA